MSKDNTQVFLLPPGSTSFGLWINQDPEIARRIESDIKKQILAQNQAERLKGLTNQQFRTNTDVSEMDGR